MGHFIARHGIKLIIALKIMVLASIFISESGLIHIGEKISRAQETEAPSTEANSPNDEFLDAEESENRRKSFFEELLTLPKVGQEESKKDELAKYFSIIERKSRQVEDRIKMMKVKSQQLRKLEKSIENKLQKLEDEMAYFQQTQQKEKKVKAERLEYLVEFYKKMTPKKAAPVFEQMDKDLVVELFNAIPQKQSMLILSLMAPEKSVEISEYFGRIQSAKEYELLKEINTALLKEFEECKIEPENQP